MPGLLNFLKMSSPERKREELYSHLTSMGIQAELAQRGRPEEVFRGAREEPMGLVYIRGQTLEWANVVQGTFRSARAGQQFHYRAPGRPYYYRIWYGVQDPNLHIKSSNIRLRSVRRWSLLALGRAVNVVWEDDVERLNLGLLSTDDDMKRCLIKEGVDVEVIGFPDGYWIISNREAGRLPSRSMWECYQTVALWLREASKSRDFRRVDGAPDPG